MNKLSHFSWSCHTIGVFACVYIQLLQHYAILLQDNITKHKYHSIDELEADIVLLCQNTHTYNVEGSQVISSCDHITLVPLYARGYMYVCK